MSAGFRNADFAGIYLSSMSTVFRRLALSTVLFGSLIGCRYDPVVWKHDFRSPDGAWIATARTDQWGGFGSAWVQTSVSVRRVDGTVNQGKPFDVFSYAGGGKVPKTYVLSEENADTDLLITWLTPTHVQISHTPGIDPTLEVIRLSNLDISFR